MTLFPALMEIVFILVLGIVCSRRNLFSQNHRDGFEILLFKVVMPSYLFSVTYQDPMDELFHIPFITAYLLSFILLSALIAVVFFKEATPIQLCIRIFSGAYVNTAIYILPIITILLKDPTAAVIANILQATLIQPLFLIILNLLKHKERSMVTKITSVFTTPLILMPILGIAFNVLHVPLPSPLLSGLILLGSGTASLALFTFGLTLGATGISKECLRFDLVGLMIIKTLIHPLIALGIAFFLKLESYWFQSLLIAASAPTAFVAYLIAKEFAVDEELVKKVVALTSLVATATLFLITVIIL